MREVERVRLVWEYRRVLVAKCLCPNDAQHPPSSGERWAARGDSRISRIRGYGDFVHYHLLARGSLDVVIESDVNILDIAALTVIRDRDRAPQRTWRAANAQPNAS